MKELFVPKNIALLAKQHGFNEDCFMTIPLFAQIVDWFREVHDIHIVINLVRSLPEWYDYRLSCERETIDSDEDESWPTYYEALTAAIEHAFKLI